MRNPVRDQPLGLAIGLSDEDVERLNRETPIIWRQFDPEYEDDTAFFEHDNVMLGHYGLASESFLATVSMAHHMADGHMRAVLVMPHEAEFLSGSRPSFDLITTNLPDAIAFWQKPRRP